MCLKDFIHWVVNPNSEGRGTFSKLHVHVSLRKSLSFSRKDWPDSRQELRGEFSYTGIQGKMISCSCANVVSLSCELAGAYKYVRGVCTKYWCQLKINKTKVTTKWFLKHWKIDAIQLFFFWPTHNKCNIFKFDGLYYTGRSLPMPGLSWSARPWTKGEREVQIQVSSTRICS